MYAEALFTRGHYPKRRAAKQNENLAQNQEPRGTRTGKKRIPGTYPRNYLGGICGASFRSNLRETDAVACQQGRTRRMPTPVPAERLLSNVGRCRNRRVSDPTGTSSAALRALFLPLLLLLTGAAPDLKYYRLEQVVFGIE